MTEIHIRVGPRRYRVLDDPVDISLPLDFHGAQPRHFGAPAASARPLEAGDFVGDIRLGGSCNCEVLTLAPHCNGTHTECIGHVAPEATGVGSLARDALIPTLLLSVPTSPAEGCEEDADPTPAHGDMLVTAASLEHALRRSDAEPQPGLALRTLPNDTGKRSRDYGQDGMPAYLTTQAVELVVRWGVQHLLVDLPSLDRTHDEGRLTGHRLFWDLPAGGTDAARSGRRTATLTEMIFVPDEVADGLYAMNLQIAPFVTDAAPSRPLLFPLIPA